REQRPRSGRGRGDQNIYAGKIRRRLCLSRSVHRRQLDGEAEMRAVVGRIEGDRAAHALDDARGNGKAESRATMPARQRRVALLELAEDALARGGFDPRPGIADFKRDASVRRALDNDGDAAAVGEL